MHLVLKQLRRKGAGIARFYGANHSPPKFSYAFSWRKELSTTSNASKSRGSHPLKVSPTSGNQMVKLAVGSAAVIAAITAALYAEWPEETPFGGSKKEQAPRLNEIEQGDVKVSAVDNDGHLDDKGSTHSEENLTSSSLYKDKEEVIIGETEESDKADESHPRQDQEGYPKQGESEVMQKEITTEGPEIHAEHEVNISGENRLTSSNEKKQQGLESSNDTKGIGVLDDVNGISLQETPSEGDHGVKISVSADVKELDENIENKKAMAPGDPINNEKDSEIGAGPYHELIASKALQQVLQDDESQDQKSRNNLSDTQLLWKGHELNSQRFSNVKDGGVLNPVTEQKEDVRDGMEDSKDQDVSNDGLLVLNIIEAIHAAEQKQAESDARVYAQYRQKLKEKYEKELKDARARELMYAEEVHSLEKELNKEKAKAAAALKALNDKAEERLKTELRFKEEEVEMKLKRAQLLAKAETAAAVANEKSSHLSQMADANHQINALCMAFYARSEEARQSHFVHKLALGTFALENAVMKGAPLYEEIAALRRSMEGIDKDALLDVALSTLPPEALTYGTKTQAQLHQKFEALKGTLRELVLIPAGGGGLLTHALARFAAAVKVREDGLYTEGMESIIAHVEHYLTEGKLVEAANALEKGAQGSQAEILAAEWARQTRNRAVTEQALSVLEAYATAIAFSLT